MDEPINAFRRWIAGQYQNQKLTLKDPAYEYAKDSAVLINVDDDLKNIDGPSNNALILDPDVGIALFMLNYNDDVDMRAQIARAVRYRTQLLRRRIDQEKSDERGSWRVILHWFVNENDRLDWIESAARMRRDTAHLEELPIDAIFCRDGDWYNAIEEHSIPRLLFRTRNVLGMHSDEDVLLWSSADTRVKNALEGFSSDFKDDLDKEFAARVEHWLTENQERNTSSKKTVATKNDSIVHFGVRNFRNIESFDIRFKKGQVQASVIHGPNGTGKSNLFEALEFALCGCSRKAEKFIKDKDVTKTKKSKEYLERYIKPIQGSGTETRIEFNEKSQNIFVDENGDEITVADELRANFLTQEDSWKFSELKASNLASEILGEFSDLAYRVTNYSEGELEKARAGQDRLLSNLGLTRQVKRIETAYKKITQQYLVDAVAQPRSITDWLTNPFHQFSSMTVNSNKYSKELIELVDQAEVVSNTLHGRLSLDNIEDLISAYLKDSWAKIRSTTVFIADINIMIDTWPENIAEKLQLWGTWLINQKQELSDKPISEDLSKKENIRLEIESTLEQITKKGSILAEREGYFDKVESFLKRVWLSVDPDHCPTCETDLGERGGVEEVVNYIRDKNKTDLEDSRKSYKDNKDKLDTLMKALGEIPMSRCPISDDEQDDIRRAISAYLPENEELSNILSNYDKQKQLIEWVNLVTRIPMKPSIINEEQVNEKINEISNKLSQAYRDIDTTFASPAAWDRVVKKLKNRLADVLDQHLPNTLGGVWKELVLNITPARWQMPGDLGLSLENRRGSNNATVDLVSGNSSWLARYILNAAESHVLGIAWFFTKYLTHGRFKYPLLVMDDPAQEMDQTTYRDLCRLFETLLRLHSLHKLPISLLLFLHQDERALDAARSTGALLYRLNWNRGRSVLAESNYLYSPEHLHPAPSEFIRNFENV